MCTPTCHRALRALLAPHRTQAQLAKLSTTSRTSLHTLKLVQQHALLHAEQEDALPLHGLRLHAEPKPKPEPAVVVVVASPSKPQIVTGMRSNLGTGHRRLHTDMSAKISSRSSNTSASNTSRLDTAATARGPPSAATASPTSAVSAVARELSRAREKMAMQLALARERKLSHADLQDGFDL